MNDLRKFNLGESASLITDIILSSWGNEICFQCKYLLREDMSYSLSFVNCFQINWEVNSPELREDTEADIIFVDFGKSNHKEAASIHTDIFTVEILYGELKFEKDW